MLKLSAKKLAYKEKFRKLGAAISAMKPRHTTDLDYHTGKESEFDMTRGDQGYRTETGERVEIPGGPKFKTPQWERTVRQH